MPSFLGVPVDAAYHLVSALTGVLIPVLGGLAAAAAILAFTMAVRLLIAPLSFRALRGQAAQARLAPQLQALRKRYARQPERFQREVTALYKREGTTLLAGIWPMLAQWPFLSVLYVLFRSPSVAGGPNQLLAHSLLRVPLGAHWLSGPGLASVQGGVFLGVFALLAGLCWLSARVARRMTGATETTPAPAPARGGGRLIIAAVPYVTVVFAAFMPLAAGLYLVTTVAWSTGERWLFARRAGAYHGDHAFRRSRRARPRRVPLVHLRRLRARLPLSRARLRGPRPGL